MPNNDDKKKQRGEVVRALSHISQLGVTMAACVLIGVFLGMFLDRLLGTGPWLLLVCSLLGMAAAFKTLFDIANKK